MLHRLAGHRRGAWQRKARYMRLCCFVTEGIATVADITEAGQARSVPPEAARQFGRGELTPLDLGQ